MVTVVGLGFVGLTTALSFAEHGYKVYGIEANVERSEKLCLGEVPFFEPELEFILKRNIGKNLIVTSDWERAMAESSYIFYCVGTPYGKDGYADLSYLYDALSQTLLSTHDNRFRVLVIKSTIPPSTTEECIIPFLKENGAKIPEQFGVANNPEFLREGHCWEDTVEADRIVVGVTDVQSEKMLKQLYTYETIPVCCVSLNTSEFIKYLSNSSLACLISFANEMSIVADAIGGIDIANAFRILHMDKRWQTGNIRSYFYPGCGYGGYCLPKDTRALYAVARKKGVNGKILKNVIATNDVMPGIVTKRIIQETKDNKSICIGILGLAFNKGSSDVRDTPSAKIIQKLNEFGYKNIIAYDPVAMNEFQMAFDMQYYCVETYVEFLEKCEVVAIITAWPEFRDIKNKTKKPIVDCRYML